MPTSYSRYWGSGSTTAWRKKRAKVLERDMFECQLKLPDVCTFRATQVHHLDGKQYGDDDLARLTSACKPCNQKLGNPGAHDPAPLARGEW